MAFLVRCPCGRPRRVEQPGAFECADVECGRTCLAGRHSRWNVPWCEVISFLCSPRHAMTQSLVHSTWVPEVGGGDHITVTLFGEMRVA